MVIFDSILRACNVTASIAIVALMALISADVLGRAVFDNPLVGVPEIVKLTIVAIVWLQFAYTLRTNQHLRSNLVFGLLPRGGRRAIYGLNCAVGIVVFGLICRYGADNALETFRSGVFEGEHPMRIPVWPVWAIVALGSLLMALEYIRQGIGAVIGQPCPVCDEQSPAVLKEVA